MTDHDDEDERYDRIDRLQAFVSLLRSDIGEIDEETRAYLAWAIEQLKDGHNVPVTDFEQQRMLLGLPDPE